MGEGLYHFLLPRASGGGTVRFTDRVKAFALGLEALMVWFSWDHMESPLVRAG